MEKIGPVTKSDAAQIANIYNYYIENSTITFEEEKVSEDEMCERIKNISAKFPYLKIQENEEVLGYAYATSWRVRSAYRFSAEITIYLKNDIQRKGYGSKLFSALLEELRKTGIHVLVGGIALPNPASVGLHEKFGFKKIAQFEEIGFKFGQWIDVGYWELKI